MGWIELSSSEHFSATKDVVFDARGEFHLSGRAESIREGVDATQARTRRSGQEGDARVT